LYEWYMTTVRMLRNGFVASHISKSIPFHCQPSTNGSKVLSQVNNLMQRGA
jgi:hypothetical protein